jgi:lipopolysaccharide export LptBFGC system permease protein LptF
MSADQLRVAAGGFQSRIRRRNAREYLAALVVVVFFGFQLAKAGDPLVRAGMGMIIASMFYIVWHLHSKGSANALPEDAGRQSYLDFQRAELARQRDLLRGVWRWYLGPMIPGMAVLIVAFAHANPAHMHHPVIVEGVYAAFVAAVFWFIGRLNTRAARRLDRRIEELDRSRAED